MCERVLSRLCFAWGCGRADWQGFVERSLMVGNGPADVTTQMAEQVFLPPPFLFTFHLPKTSLGIWFPHSLVNDI